MPVPLNDYFGDDVQIGCELSDDNAVSFRQPVQVVVGDMSNGSPGYGEIGSVGDGGEDGPSL